MEKNFCIYCPIKPKDIIQITNDEYEELKKAKFMLQQYLYIEEKLNFIIENYLELEKEILNISISNLVTPLSSREWTNSVDEIHKVNRRIINLLTTSRMYLDHVSHDLKKVCQDKLDVIPMFEKLKNIEYESVLGYRVMEALRNFVQHRGLPIHLLSHNVSKTKDNRIKHLLFPVIRVRDLEEDGKFKRAVLEELKNIGDRVDIRLYIRQYVQSFYKFQKFIRDIFIEDRLEYDNLINEAYKKYEDKYGKITSFLAISDYHLDNCHKDVNYILRDIITRRIWLEEKNNIDKDLTINFVSGEL